MRINHMARSGEDNSVRVVYVSRDGDFQGSAEVTNRCSRRRVYDVRWSKTSCLYGLELFMYLKLPSHKQLFVPDDEEEEEDRRCGSCA